MSMEMIITSTDQITVVDGVECRVWHGITLDGNECIVFVHRIAVKKDADCSEFERELLEQLPPGRVVPLRDVLP